MNPHDGDQSKGDRLITLLTEMAEDEDSTGVLDYGDVVTGRYTVTIDGRRATLYLDPPGEAEAT